MPSQLGVCIVGASTRAAAFSALRAGMVPACADLFADRDLAARCRVIGVRRYPAGLQQAIAALPPGPWMFTGALENHPRMIARLAGKRRLWGNGADVLRRVRNPCAVADSLRRAGLPFAPVRTSSEGLPTDGSWLCKPARSAGGAGLRAWHGPARQAATHGCYFQQRVEGLACAAIFVADGATACFVAATRQLVGEAAFGARPFAYCGSIGPLNLAEETERQLRRLGRTLAADFRLIGLFGVDGILAGECFIPVEVNPRYTASVEVVEMCTGWSSLESHAIACERRALRVEVDRSRAVQVGKAVLYARRTVRVPDLMPWAGLAGGWGKAQRAPAGGDQANGREELDRLAAADIPRAGSVIRAGRPILTLFARGADPLRELRERAELFYAAVSAEPP